MKILFIGQLGVSRWPQSTPTSTEARVEAIATTLAQKGHRVFMAATAPHLSPRLSHTYGITIKKHASLNPQQPGGWLYVLGSLITLWRLQPDVAHLHGWKAGALSWLAALVSPETTLVWTIDTLPKKHLVLRKISIWQAQLVCDSITTPSRTLQYLLRHTTNLKAEYVPDGFSTVSIKPIALRTFRLQKGNYWVAFVSSAHTAKKVVALYKKVRSRKKLVLVTPTDASLMRRMTQDARCLSIDPRHMRSVHSLLQGTNVALLADENIAVPTVLKTMAAATIVIAPNTSLYQETLGTTGVYFRHTRLAESIDLLKNAFKKNSPFTKLASQAQMRAQRHFTWERIASEYLGLYNRVRAVIGTVDSLSPLPVSEKLSVTSKY